MECKKFAFAQASNNKLLLFNLTVHHILLRWLSYIVSCTKLPNKKARALEKISKSLMIYTLSLF